MKKLTSVFVVAIAFGLLACNASEQEGNGNDIAAHEATQQQAEDDGISLNDGLKWSANAETTAGIKDMQQAITSFTAKADSNACEQLAYTLKERFDGIIRDCTMTGEAHEQLHHFILPLQEMIQTLSTAQPSDCNKRTRDVSEYLETYYTFFE